jgi:hypothetical protein
MRRLPILGFLISLTCAEGLLASNPNDVNFSLQLTRDTRLYHIGELIEFEISYTSESEQKYVVSAGQPSPELSSVTLRLSPSEGVLDLAVLRQCAGFAGSHLSSGPQYLTSKPISEKADLQGWYRFQKPGHYSLTATSSEVWRAKSVDEGGGQEYLTLESNSVEFDVLPTDPSWEAEELGKILRVLEGANGSGERFGAQYRLSLLDTPDSVQKSTELFLFKAYPERYTYANALTSSSRIDLIIPVLEKALSDPDVSPLGVPELLADLQVRKQLGFPQILQGNERARAQCEERSKLREEYLAKDNALLLARIGRASGPLQNESIYEVWRNAENAAANSGPVPQPLTQLRLAALNVAQNLHPDQQTQLLITLWKDLPHEQLLPLIHDLAPAGTIDAFRLWCEGWPAECSEVILSEALKPSTQISTPVVLLISEGEHKELDSVLNGALTNPAMLQDSLASVRTAAMVLRAGSRELLPAVDKVLTQSNTSQRFNCQVRGYFLGYLFRVAPEHAESRLGESLQDEKCGNQLFHILNTVRPSEGMLPVAVSALNSLDLAIAGQAALFLAEHGHGAAEDLLWRRLDALWNLWHDKTAELRANSPQASVQRQTALLEQSLASALSHATNWNLTSAERDRLRSGCLTEQCQRIAEGKMSLVF